MKRAMVVAVAAVEVLAPLACMAIGAAHLHASAPWLVVGAALWHRYLIDAKGRSR